MNLFLLRHASAGVRRMNPVLDVKRPLDKDGKRHCLQLAHVLNAMKLSFDLVVSSPLKRSLQTAQLVATETGYESEDPDLERSGARARPSSSFSGCCASARTTKTCSWWGTTRTSRRSWGSSLSAAPAVNSRDSGRASVCAKARSRSSACSAARHIAVADRPAHRARALRQLDQELAAKDLAEVSPPPSSATTASSSAPPRAGQQLQHARAWDRLRSRICTAARGAVLIERLRQPQQNDGRCTLRMLLDGHVAHGPVHRLGAALAEVARDGRDNRALRGREAEDFRVRNDVLRVPMVALVVHELADVLHHGRGLQPQPVLGGQLVHLLQLVEELQRSARAPARPFRGRRRSGGRPRSTPSQRSASIVRWALARMSTSASICASMPSRRPSGE